MGWDPCPVHMSSIQTSEETEATERASSSKSQLMTVGFVI